MLTNNYYYTFTENAILVKILVPLSLELVLLLTYIMKTNLLIRNLLIVSAAVCLFAYITIRMYRDFRIKELALNFENIDEEEDAIIYMTYYTQLFENNSGAKREEALIVGLIM
jgi:hypothetical protein